MCNESGVHTWTQTHTRVSYTPACTKACVFYTRKGITCAAVRHAHPERVVHTERGSQAKYTHGGWCHTGTYARVSHRGGCHTHVVHLSHMHRCHMEQGGAYTEVSHVCAIHIRVADTYTKQVVCSAECCR